MSWRPNKLSEFIGQKSAIRMLDVCVRAALRSGEALPHMILYGHPGAGKTTIARLLAAERGVDFYEVTGDSLRSRSDVNNFFKNISKDGYHRDKQDPLHLQKVGPTRPTILFIDEIHAISRKAAEVMYKPLEDFLWETDGSKMGMGSGVVQAQIAPFTLIGATTDLGSLPQPLIDRTETIYMEPYSINDLEVIVINHGHWNGWVRLTNEVVLMVAKQARNTPRLAVELYKKLNRWATAEDWQEVDVPQAEQVFQLIGIDTSGLNRIDTRLLSVLASCESPQGGDALAAKLGESRDNVAISERFLLAIGAIDITPRGRVITIHGRELCPER